MVASFTDIGGHPISALFRPDPEIGSRSPWRRSCKGIWNSGVSVQKGAKQFPEDANLLN